MAWYVDEKFLSKFLSTFFIILSPRFADKIIISKIESQSQWQQGDYKAFSPNTDWDNVDFSKAPAIQEMPVISAICKPEQSEKVKIKDGKIDVKGIIFMKVKI